MTTRQYVHSSERSGASLHNFRGCGTAANSVTYGQSALNFSNSSFALPLIPYHFNAIEWLSLISRNSWHFLLVLNLSLIGVLLLIRGGK